MNSVNLLNLIKKCLEPSSDKTLYRELPSCEEKKAKNSEGQIVWQEKTHNCKVCCRNPITKAIPEPKSLEASIKSRDVDSRGVLQKVRDPTARRSDFLPSTTSSSASCPDSGGTSTFPDLPVTVRRSMDGEEGYLESQRQLMKCMQSTEISRIFRPAPNRTLFDVKDK